MNQGSGWCFPVEVIRHGAIHNDTVKYFKARYTKNNNNNHLFPIWVHVSRYFFHLLMLFVYRKKAVS